MLLRIVFTMDNMFQVSGLVGCLFYLLDLVSVWTGQGAWGLPAGHASASAVLHLIRELQQQKRAQASPVDASFLLHGIAVQKEAAVLLGDNHAVEKEAVLLLGAPAH